MLAEIPPGKEIYQAMLIMGSYKSPGPDGVSVTFFKIYYEIIEKDVINQVQKVFRLRRVPKAFNHTFITLIPKLVKASKVDQYMPISLGNVPLKIINKIMATKKIVGRYHSPKSSFICSKPSN